MTMNKTTASEIRLTVELDENKIPQRLAWQATDAGEGEKDCKAFMLSIWDAADKSSLRIDLWTKEMRVDEMTRHFIQTLISSAQTFERATQTTGVATEVKKFCDSLTVKIGEQLEKK